MKRYIEVYEIETDKVIHKVDVSKKSDSLAEKVMDGLDNRIRDGYATRLVSRS